MTANLPYGPPLNTHIDYYQTLFYSDFFFVSVAMLVVQSLQYTVNPLLRDHSWEAVKVVS